MTTSLLLALSCWSSIALASDAPLAAERTVETPAEIAAIVQAVRAAAGGPVLIAAAGPEAERAALEATKGMAAGVVRVQRVGIIGGEEVQRALAGAGLACAVRVGATPSGAWTLAPFGNCSGGAAAAAPVAAPAPAAAPPAVGVIPGAGAALGGAHTPAASAPAPTAPQPLLAPPPPSREALESTYATVALQRVPNPKPRPELPETTWIVRDGRGRTLDATDFAKRTGDLATEKRITREGRVGKALGLGLAIGGGALLVSGLGVLAARDAGAPDFSDFEPDLGDFDSNADYFEALAQAEADYRAAQDAHDILREDRVWIAGALTGAGVLALGASPFAAQGSVDRRTLPSLYWDPDTADALIKAHNDAVKQRIGLADPPPARAVIVAPPEEPEEPEDPPEDAEPDGGGEPDEEAPRALPPADPSGPSGAREIHITPVLGVAWAGIAGTF